MGQGCNDDRFDFSASYQHLQTKLEAHRQTTVMYFLEIKFNPGSIPIEHLTRSLSSKLFSLEVCIHLFSEYRC